MRTRFPRLFAALSSVCLALAGPQALAGYYKLDNPSTTNDTSDGYSGGQFSNGTSSSPYNGAAGEGTWGAWLGGMNVSCTGAITAHFTWVPDYPGEPPPKKAIVAEHCKAYYSGMGGGGSCSNGLGDSEVKTTTPPQPGQPAPVYTGKSGYNPDGTAIGHYWVKTDPGQHFTITCSPSASFSTPFGGQCGVLYWASASPLEVVLSGGIGFQNAKRYLIGQQCTATLTSPLQVTSWRWSASGGDPFKNWTASQTQGVFTSFEATIETGSSLVCYFKYPASTNVSCTAHLSVPPGAKPAAGLDVTVDKSATVAQPSSSLSAYIGTVQGVPDSANPGGMQLTGHRYTDYNNVTWVMGIRWEGNVTTPEDFVNPPFGYGGWNWVQLLNPMHRRRFYQGRWQKLRKNDIPRVLDNTYPYEPSPYTQHPGDAGRYMANGVMAWDSDSPSIGFNGGTMHEVLDSFDTYLMYLPPDPPGMDGSSRFVPLKKLVWYWEGDASWVSPTGVWQILNTAAQWSFDGNFPLHPRWSDRVVNVPDLSDWIDE